MKQLLRNLLFLLIIVIICAIFFYPTFLYGLLPAPTDTLIGMYHPWLDQAATLHPAGVPFKNFLITDPIRQQIPWRKLVVDDLKKGMLPVWNPYNFSGAPLLANIQAGAWYPLNILFFFLPFPIAWTTLIIVQPMLASLFLFAFLRHKKISSAIAASLGLAWAFSGFSIAWLTWGTILQTALWLPLILLAIDRVLESTQTKQTIVWGVTLVIAPACSLFAGHAQVALYVYTISFVYALFAVWYARERKKGWFLLVALVLVGIITSPQWMPLIRFLPETSRITDTTAWLKDGWFLPWQNLLQFVAPDFFGNPATLNYWGVWNYGEFIGYIGILPLILAFYAVIVRRDRLTRFFAISAGLVLLFLLPTPIAKIPFQLRLPILFSLQPTRLMVLLDFSLVMLAALGFDHYFKNANKKILIGILLIALVLAGMWIYVIRTVGSTSATEILTNLQVTKRNLILPSILLAVDSVLLALFFVIKKRGRTLLVFLAMAVIGFDLFRFGWKFTPFTPIEYFFPTTKAISFLQSQQKPFRVMSLDNRILPPNVNAYYGIESIEGYDPVYDARYEEFVAALNRREPNIQPPFGFNRIITASTMDSPLLPLLNVKYILALDDVKSADTELIYREGNTRVYFYKKVLPRIYPVESVVVASNKQQVMDELYAPTFQPGRQAVIEEQVDIPDSLFTPEDRIDIMSETPRTLTAAITSPRDHFVVISDMYLPGWQAFIDSVPTHIYRTDYVLQGVRVPKGKHTLLLQYD